MSARSSLSPAEPRGSRLAPGYILLVGALWCVAQGGAPYAIGGAALGALALHLLAGGLTREGGKFENVAIDFAVLALLGLAVERGAALWGAPQSLGDLLRLTPVGAGFATALYLLVGLFSLLLKGERLGRRTSAALLVMPFIFNLLLGIGSPLLDRTALALGGAATLPLTQMILRAAIVFILNEAVVWGASLAVGHKATHGFRLHLTLALAALAAAATPLAAAGGSLPFVAALPAPLMIGVAALAAALAQAGLWAEVYLVTGVLGDILHGAPPVTPTLLRYWRTGAAKGAVYGSVFIALLLTARVVFDSPEATSLFLGSGLIGAALAGAALFPLARNILESTDSTPPFFKRLVAQYRAPSNFLTGAIIGVGVLLAFGRALPSASGGERFLFGFWVGALAYAGALLIGDVLSIATGPRERLRLWRPYALGAVLGGVVGGAIGWYFDVGQLAVVRAHFIDHVLVNYQAAGRSENPYIITPFFSKWGVTQMGAISGGVKLFYLESLSGVIQWVFAAPLFSINLFFLTALLKRDLAPLRLLFSAEGARRLADNAVVVLRWGLWMAPIIYAFLKASPDPAWYNQDGLIRTGVATFMNASLPPSQFRDWSLSIFTALLTYDWLRVLIWFDHMGLRVATLVNLSFVGGDMADEQAARFLGAKAKARAIPEGLRRFGTWAPLLIPFYIPRGAEWDKAWDAAEAAQRNGMPPAMTLMLGYILFVSAVCAALALYLLGRSRGRAAAKVVVEPMTLGNGLLTLTVGADGQGFTRVETAARRGPSIDMTRWPDDPLLPRGKFIYFSESQANSSGSEAKGARLWSLGAAPVGLGACHVEKPSADSLLMTSQCHDLRAEAQITMAEGDAVEICRVKLINLGGSPRKLRVATYRDWVMNEGGVERRDAAYNAIHVGTTFVRSLGAIFARNRLLKNQSGDFASKRLSREIAFHAASGGNLIGYEDVRARFFGLGQRRDPDALTQKLDLRDPADEGLLYGFDPCACLMLEVELPPFGSAELTFVDGWAQDENLAAAAIARHLQIAAPDPSALTAVFERRRVLAKAIVPYKPRYDFAPDGLALHTAPGAPRPFAHVLANPLGLGAVATHDGDIFSFYRNARANSLTPFRMGEGRNGPPGQIIYVVEQSTGQTHSAGMLPLRRADTQYDATFGRGSVTLTSESPTLGLEQVLFIAPDEPVQILRLTLRNRTNREQAYSIVPVLEMVLAETPPDSVGRLLARTDDSGHAVYFSNPSNDFVRGWSFVTTSLDAEFVETLRARIVSGRKVIPYLAEHGHPDYSAVDDGRRAAGFAGVIHAPAGGEVSISVALGATATFEEAKALAIRARPLAYAEEKFAAMGGFWENTLSTMRIKTNRPDFDRLVNDWLPYQLLNARLWGRTGPAQRSGAFGYRDQLQDVLPLILLAPQLARRQILLHGRQQFIEGDVLKWWHEAPQGGVGIGERTHASDPHLWLPYVTARYVAATGDAEILDEILPFVEGEAVPSGVEGHVISPLPSNERASLRNHCCRAIDYTLAHFGKNGLPLMGAGDWDDGMNLVGFKGRGESVWVGFFLYDILGSFIALLEAQGEVKQARAYAARAKDLRKALDACWRGDRYVRAFGDDGAEFTPMGALSSAWPALSGAAEGERGRDALENGLAALDKGDRVLLVAPPYDENSKPFPGRSADYPPGVRENGGQYSHGSSWFVDALVKLGERRAGSDPAQALRDYARAFEVWQSISPLTKTSPQKIDLYGLPPHQQPADVYQGFGYEGRGGWAWYSGAAARMISAAHALLGIGLEEGELKLRPDAFAEKAGMKLESVTYKGKVYTGE